MNVSVASNQDWDELPSFPNLKIGCGSFKNVDGEHEAVAKIPSMMVIIC